MDRAPDPADRRSSLISVSAGRAHAAAPPALAQEPVPRAPPRHPGARGGRDARPRRRHPRASARRGGPPVTAALGRSFSSLSVPNYRRYFAGQVVSLSGNWMQTVAEVWLILQADRQRHARRRRRRPAVPPGARRGRVGRPPRRPHLEAPAAHDHAGADGASGAHAVGADRQGRRDARDRARPDLPARLRHRVRQPRPPELRRRDGRLRPRRERDLAQQRHRPHGADRRPRHRRRRDRPARRRRRASSSTR